MFTDFQSNRSKVGTNQRPEKGPNQVFQGLWLVVDNDILVTVWAAAADPEGEIWNLKLLLRTK